MPDNTNQKNKSDTGKSDLNKDREQMGNQGRQGQSQGGMKQDKGSTNIEKEDVRQVSNDNDLDSDFEDKEEGAEIEDQPRQGNQSQVSGTNRGSVDRDRK